MATPPVLNPNNRDLWGAVSAWPRHPSRQWKLGSQLLGQAPVLLLQSAPQTILEGQEAEGAGVLQIVSPLVLSRFPLIGIVQQALDLILPATICTASRKHLFRSRFLFLALGEIQTGLEGLLAKTEIPSTAVSESQHESSLEVGRNQLHGSLSGMNRFIQNSGLQRSIQVGDPRCAMGR